MSEAKHREYLNTFLECIKSLDESNDTKGVLVLLPHMQAIIRNAYDAGYRALAKNYDRLLQDYV